MAFKVGETGVIGMRRAAPAGLPLGLNLSGSGSGRGISGWIRGIKATIERHVLWFIKAGLAWICGATAAATIVGFLVHAVFYWPLWIIYWVISQVCGLFDASLLFAPAAPAVVTLEVIFWLMAAWAVAGTGWDWECDRLEQLCLLLMCSVAVGAGGTTGAFASWMIERGHDLGQLTLGHLLGG